MRDLCKRISIPFSPTRLRSVLRTVLRTLLPSFVVGASSPRATTNRNIHRTSYLDGLRGVAAFVVFVCHYTEERHAWFLPSYGLNGNQFPHSVSHTPVPSAILQLPLLRLVYAGRPMVHIFFVISGFALSYRPLQLLHGPSRTEAHLGRFAAALASSAIRRPVRLFVPCAVSTLCVAALTQAGLLYTPAPSAPAQLRSWTRVFFGAIAWPWEWDRDLRPGYDIHLWTIPIEFAHSMLLFLVLLVLAPLPTPSRRRAAVALLVAYCVVAGKWAASEFLAGLALAEAHIQGETRAASIWSTRAHRCHRHCRLIRSALHGALLLAALFVGGWPNKGAAQTPGIRWLLARTPPSFAAAPEQAQKFWFGVAAVGVVWSVGSVAVLRRAFETPLAQYAGRISYAIYLVHGPALYALQDRVLGRPGVPVLSGSEAHGANVTAVVGHGVKGFFGVDSPAQRMTTWFIGLLLLGPLIVWLADVFWRLIDTPSVRLGRRIERACIEQVGSDSSNASNVSAMSPSSTAVSQMAASDENSTKEKGLRSQDGYSFLG